MYVCVICEKEAAGCWHILRGGSTGFLDNFAIVANRYCPEETLESPSFPVSIAASPRTFVTRQIDAVETVDLQEGLAERSRVFVG